jgi:hypothetical protein
VATSSAQPAATDLVEALHHATANEQLAAWLVTDLETRHSAWTRWSADSFEDRLAGTVAALELSRRHPEAIDEKQTRELLDQLHAFEDARRGDRQNADSCDRVTHTRRSLGEDLDNQEVLDDCEPMTSVVDEPDLTLG